jgi:lipid-binding SYLF domain-containing protein
MKLRSLLAASAALLAFCAPGALAATDKAGKQAEVQKATQASLAKFYKAKPALQSDVKAAPGYAVFTTYGLSFLLGGSGGHGVAHDARSGKDTHMRVAQASAGPQVGVSERDMLIVFKSRKAFDDFVNKGWDYSGGGVIGAGAGGKTAGGGSGEQFALDANYYVLTPNGLEFGGALTGSKFWKDKDLN